MALRVLLADESVSIKKVMQLSLQDFGVEVKAVPVGIDVLEVTRVFKPDLVFADILLAKRSGYEVSKDLKSDPTTAHIPVVLMWSGFMELDAKKAAESRIDGQLEKPFDADQLRTLVKKLVPRLGSNAISNYLQFPQRPDFVNEREDSPFALENQLADKNLANESLDTDSSEALSFEAPVGLSETTPAALDAKPTDYEPLPFLAEMDEPEDFQQVPLPKTRKDTLGLETRSLGAEETSENWMESKLSDFVVDMPADADSFEETEQDLTSTSIAIAGGESEVMLMDLDKPVEMPPSSPSKSSPKIETPRKSTAGQVKSESSPTAAALDYSRLETIAREEIRAQAQQVLEDIAWKIIPDIAERILREEIEKLLSERQDLAQ